MKKFLLTIMTFMVMIHLLHFQVIEYNIDTTLELVQKVESKTQIIKVTYTKISKENERNNYIKIVTDPTKAENMATMFVSKTTESPDVNNFSYLAREKNTNTIYVPKAYLKNGEEYQLFFHIGIVCIENCDYKIKITYENVITMTHDTKYLFLTDEAAPELTIRVDRLEQDNVIMIYALGGASNEIVSFDLKFKDKREGHGPIEIPSQTMFYNGVASVFNEQEKYPFVKEGNSYYELVLNTLPKSYIALGVRNMSKTSEIISYEVTYGLIDKNEKITKDCFKMNEGIPEPGTEHMFTLNVETFTHNAFIYLTPNVDENPSDSKFQWAIKDAGFILIDKKDLIANYICVRPSEFSTDDYLSYSLHLVDNLDAYNNQARNLPRVNGLISTHYLDRNTITFFRYYKRTIGKQRTISMTLKVIQGNPVAYAHVNTNYPDYRYSEQTLKDLDQDGKLLMIQKLNDFFSLNMEDLGNDSLVSTTQNVLIVHCLPNKPSDEDCLFQLAFTDKEDSILLRPNENFATFIHKGIEEHYSFIIKNVEPPVEKFIINLYSFSGDSGLSISIPEALDKKQVFVGNKQIITVTGDQFELVNSYSVDVIGYTNGYYSINYIPVYLSSLNIINLESGSALLETIPFGDIKTQTFYMKNKRRKQQGSFVTTFFPLNCKISVKYADIVPVEIQGIEDLFQHELISGTSTSYENDYYPYEVTVESMETLVDLCMVYISGNEILPQLEDTKITRELVLNEASTYQIVLNEQTKKMSYIYPHPGIEGEVMGFFTLEDGLVLQVTVKVESTVYSTITIRRSRVIIIQTDQLNEACKEKDFLCNVIFQVTVLNDDALTKKQKFDIQIRSESKTPGYLKKNYMSVDIKAANTMQYYFTDIEHNEEGVISLNYKRGSGKMCARLIPKEVIEENPDWNGKVKLPNENSQDLLQYDDFLKKIIITNEETKKCTLGCDLYIGITSEDQFTQEVSYLTDYSIFFQKKNVPVIININEFINGHILDLNRDHLYQVTIPYDAQKLRIDFQSEICSLYGYRGSYVKDKTPNWTFEAKKNMVFVINEEFKKNEVLIFRVASTDLNSIYSAIYIIKFDIPVTDRTNLILINSDQNILCQSEADSYCYFLLPIEFFNMLGSLAIYGYTEDYTSITIYANQAQMADFDTKTKEEIEALLPKKGNAKYSSIGSLQKDVLIINDDIIHLDAYVIIGVHVPIKTILTLVTTFRSHLKTMVLNPVSKQLIAMEKDTSLELKLPDNNNYLVNIAGLVGKGAIETNTSNNNKYQITDRRNLALVIDDNTKSLKVSSGEKFIFSVYYVIRPKENFDEIENATTNEIIYKQKDLPLVYYSKVYDENEDIIFNININSLKKQGDSRDEFDLLGIVTTEEIINKKKRDKDINPEFSKPVVGKYDPSINTGKIYFKSSYVKEYQTTSKKYLYVTFNKKFSNKNKYSEVHATISNTPSGNYEFPIAANTYFHYTLVQGQVKSSVFQLIKNDKSEKYIMFEFSSNSELVQFVYLPFDQANPESSYTNSTDINVQSKQTQFGKQTIVFDLANSKDNPDKMLIAVFYNSQDHKVEQEFLSNYVIKYSTGVEIQKGAQLKDNGKVTPTYHKNNNTLTLKFSKVVDSTGQVVNAKYTMRIIPNSEYKTSESYNSLTILDSKNPIIIKILPNEGDIIELIYTDFPLDKSYIVSILATTLQGEMLMYEYIKDPSQKDNDKGNTKFPLWLVILIVVIAVLVLAGVIGIFFYVKKLSNKFSIPEEEIGKVDEGKIGLMAPEKETIT